MCGSYIELLLGSGIVIELWCYKDTFLSMKNVSLFVTGFTKTVPISTRNEIQFVADY